MADIFDAIIVDPTVETRIRLKQAAGSVASFRKVHLINSLKDAQERITGDSEKVDVLFITDVEGDLVIKNFIQEIKKTPQGADIAFILVLGKKNQDNVTIASAMLLGPDGLLFEPYSVDALVEITHVANRVKKERAATRERGAIGIIVDDLVNQINIVSQIKAAKLDLGTSLKKLRDTASSIKTLSKESLPVYYEVAIEKFTSAVIPPPMFKVYKGASSRIKKRVEQKAASLLETPAAPEKTS